MSTVNTRARKVRPEEVQLLAAALARSFYDDPVMRHLFPSDRSRLRTLDKLHRIELAKMYLPYGAVYTTEDLQGAAIWGPPERVNAAAKDVAAMLPMVAHIAAHPARALRTFGLLEAKHPKEPHYYLATLGVDPTMQGKGLGSAMMAPVLEICDEKGLPCYLESSKEKNVPLYARHGFEVTEEVKLPVGGPPVWLMWREAQGPRS